MPFLKTHGMSKTKIYNRWSSMIQRCHNKNSKCFKGYGSNGISVCKEWHKFENYLEWSKKNGYSDDLTLDRIDEKGNYEPSNCQYLTQQEQVLKQKRNLHRKKEDKYIKKTKNGTYLLNIHKSRYGYKNYKSLLLKVYKTVEEARRARDLFLKTGNIIPNENDLIENLKKEDEIKYDNFKEEKVSKIKRSLLLKQRRREIWEKNKRQYNAS